ncbi:putative DNA repair protein rhp26 [Blattamonas nauphoetae]|uniref:DNA repair protein rhp26 n=1 Tax=Blattamonas nauphoetae TaxID=2049346 RepID=A0ABQ9Y445_9EUKA|nr:putative DNA repair protein rhp26 [Blattamonas nauphoetae]
MITPNIGQPVESERDRDLRLLAQLQERIRKLKISLSFKVAKLKNKGPGQPLDSSSFVTDPDEYAERMEMQGSSVNSLKQHIFELEQQELSLRMSLQQTEQQTVINLLESDDSASDDDEVIEGERPETPPTPPYNSSPAHPGHEPTQKFSSGALFDQIKQNRLSFATTGIPGAPISHPVDVDSRSEGAEQAVDVTEEEQRRQDRIYQSAANFQKKIGSKKLVVPALSTSHTSTETSSSDPKQRISETFRIPGQHGGKDLLIPTHIWESLYLFQQNGVRWLWEQHMQNVGGILGDEMGLGKTVQLLTFLEGLAYIGEMNTCLLLCPATVLKQWKEESQRWAPDLEGVIIHSSFSSDLNDTGSSDDEWYQQVNREEAETDSEESEDDESDDTLDVAALESFRPQKSHNTRQTRSKRRILTRLDSDSEWEKDWNSEDGAESLSSIKKQKRDEEDSGNEELPTMKVEEGQEDVTISTAPQHSSSHSPPGIPRKAPSVFSPPAKAAPPHRKTPKNTKLSLPHSTSPSEKPNTSSRTPSPSGKTPPSSRTVSPSPTVNFERHHSSYYIYDEPDEDPELVEALQTTLSLIQRSRGSSPLRAPKTVRDAMLHSPYDKALTEKIMKAFENDQERARRAKAGFVHQPASRFVSTSPVPIQDEEVPERSRSTMPSNSKRSMRPVLFITTYETVRLHPSLFLPLPFHYVILDEGQRIKNPRTIISKLIRRINTPHRIILSGSPVQNNLTELWSLIDFVHPGLLGTLGSFKQQFGVPISIGTRAGASSYQVARAVKCGVILKLMVDQVLLRRLKRKMQLRMPAKQEMLLFCRITPDQYREYVAICNSETIAYKAASRKEPIFKAIGDLRKVSNHPDLMYYHNTHKPDRYGHWMKSGKMMVLRELLTKWFVEEPAEVANKKDKPLPNKVLIFCQTRQMLDLIETMVDEFRPSLESFRMDGTTPLKRRQILIDNFNSDPTISIFLLTTNVGGVGVNMTGANKVVLFDPAWNPSVDNQAQERAWRLGQEREVTIYRLLSSGTIEESVYERQLFKEMMAGRVVKSGKEEVEKALVGNQSGMIATQGRKKKNISFGGFSLSKLFQIPDNPEYDILLELEEEKLEEEREKQALKSFLERASTKQAEEAKFKEQNKLDLEDGEVVDEDKPPQANGDDEEEFDFMAQLLLGDRKDALNDDSLKLLRESMAKQVHDPTFLDRLLKETKAKTRKTKVGGITFVDSYMERRTDFGKESTAKQVIEETAEREAAKAREEIVKSVQGQSNKQIIRTYQHNLNQISTEEGRSSGNRPSFVVPFVSSSTQSRRRTEYLPGPKPGQVIVRKRVGPGQRGRR